MNEGSYLLGEMVEVAFGREHKFGFTVTLDNPDDLDRIRAAARRAVQDELTHATTRNRRVTRIPICQCGHDDEGHPDPHPCGDPANGPVYPCNRCDCGDMRIVRWENDPQVIHRTS